MGHLDDGVQLLRDLIRYVSTEDIEEQERKIEEIDAAVREYIAGLPPGVRSLESVRPVLDMLGQRLVAGAIVDQARGRNLRVID